MAGPKNVSALCPAADTAGSVTDSFYRVAGGPANTMAWVKSEYAGELAVLSTWLVAVAPWSVSVFGDGFTGVVFRFLPFRLQYLFGLEVSNELTFLWVWDVAGTQGGNTVLAADVGTAAAALFAVGFALSVYYYLREESLETALPVDPVRVLGGVLGAVGLLTLAASVLLNLSGGFSGTTIPVGALVTPVLAGVLLTVDRA